MISRALPLRHKQRAYDIILIYSVSYFVQSLLTISYEV